MKQRFDIALFSAKKKQQKQEQEQTRISNVKDGTYEYRLQMYKERCLQQNIVIQQLEEDKIQLERKFREEIRLLEEQRDILKQELQKHQSENTNNADDHVSILQEYPDQLKQAQNQEEYNQRMLIRHRFKYRRRWTEQQKMFHILRFQNLGTGRYQRDYQMMMKFMKQEQQFPNARTVQNWKNILVQSSKIYKACIDFEFIPDSSLDEQLKQWKSNNNLSQDEVINAVLEVDAFNVNQQVYIKDGQVYDVISVADKKTGKISQVGIRAVFSYVIVTECESKPLPIFSQYDADGHAREFTIETIIKICQYLETQKIHISTVGHDSDTKYQLIQEYPLQVIKRKYEDKKQRFKHDPYSLIEDTINLAASAAFKNKYTLLLSVNDTKHLLKNLRNLFNKKIPLSTSNKLDNSYIDYSYIKSVLQDELPESVFDDNALNRMSDIDALRLYQSRSVTKLFNAAKLNDEATNDENFGQKLTPQRLAKYRASIYWLLVFPLVMTDLQCDGTTLQLIFVWALFVSIKLHTRNQKSISVDIFILLYYMAMNAVHRKIQSRGRPIQLLTVRSVIF
ncbi:Hypothetical_protein [Hexamita inflata]|uniref:Hypothetical_protein n=1 Tax=Hexamita inflata TaxID=28002 RepID=A0AA86P7F6_9EUKA|nr:Hypothetical protein HINF_LOCUS20645 [Hexamita inflata]